MPLSGKPKLPCVCTLDPQRMVGIRAVLSELATCMQDGWGHLPHDLLVAMVQHLEPRDAKAMHRVCASWHLAVRCGLQSMKPSPKHTAFPDIRDCFPRVRLPAKAHSPHLDCAEQG